MKLQLIGAVLLTWALSSCKKDFLELPPETTLTTPIFYKTQADFQQGINGAYAPLRTLYNNAANNNSSAYLMGEMHSDNTHYALNPNFRATLDQEQIADFIYEPANPIIAAKYTPILHKG